MSERKKRQKNKKLNDSSSLSSFAESDEQPKRGRTKIIESSSSSEHKPIIKKIIRKNIKTNDKTNNKEQKPKR